MINNILVTKLSGTLDKVLYTSILEKSAFSQFIIFFYCSNTNFIEVVFQLWGTALSIGVCISSMGQIKYVACHKGQNSKDYHVIGTKMWQGWTIFVWWIPNPPSLDNWISNGNTDLNNKKTWTDSLPLKKITHYHKNEWQHNVKLFPC